MRGWKDGSYLSLTSIRLSQQKRPVGDKQKLVSACLTEQRTPRRKRLREAEGEQQREGGREGELEKVPNRPYSMTLKYFIKALDVHSVCTYTHWLALHTLAQMGVVVVKAQLAETRTWPALEHSAALNKQTKANLQYTQIWSCKALSYKRTLEMKGSRSEPRIWCLVALSEVFVLSKTTYVQTWWLFKAAGGGGGNICGNQQATTLVSTFTHM